MKETAQLNRDQFESSQEDQRSGLRPMAWPMLVERFAKLRSFRNWHFQMDTNDTFNALSNKHNTLSESGERKFCVNPNGLGIRKMIGGKTIVPSKRNRLAPEEEHD